MASPVAGGIVVQWLNWHAALLVLALFGAATPCHLALRRDVPRRDRAPRSGRCSRPTGAPMLAPGASAPGRFSRASAYGALFFLLAGTSFRHIGVLARARWLRADHAGAVERLFCRHLLVPAACALRPARAVARRVAHAGRWRRHGWRWRWPACMRGGDAASILFCIARRAPALRPGRRVGPFPEKAGTAASLSGFWMTAMAFVVGSSSAAAAAPNSTR